MLAQLNKSLFSSLCYLSMLFFLGTSLQASAEEKNQVKQEFLHFGNMGGLLPTLATDDLPEPDSNGAKMIYYFCGQCHNVPGPGMHTEKEWNHVFWKMYWRMHLMKAQFTSFKVPKYDEGQIMFDYLKKNAMLSIKSSEVDADSLGAKEYMRTCMQCHNLPNPKLHKKTEWPAVVKRMQRHMKSMGKVSPSKDEERLIIQYLKTETAR